MVEFALCVPLLLMLLIGTIYFGRAFFLKQIILAAAQEGARLASRTPNLADNAVRDTVRGFTTSGAVANTSSVIYAALAAGYLLSDGAAGDLPSGAQVKILPWDSDGASTDSIPNGTVAVVINYPFNFNVQSAGNASNNASGGFDIATSIDGTSNPVHLPSFTVSEKAVSAAEIYQEVN